MAEIKNTAVGNANIEQKRIVVDMSKEIAFLEPSATPFTVLTKKLNTVACHQPKYEWMDNDTETRWTATTATALVGASTIAVTAGTGKYFAAGDLIKNVTTGETMQVTGVAADTLTILRGIGSTAVAVGSGDKILLVGNASMQGSGAPAEKVIGVTPFFNYTQIFKTAFSITNTLDATKLYGMDEKARLRKNNGIVHAKSIEYAALFGTKSIDTTGSQPITTTEGIITSLATNPNNVSKAKATATESDLLGFCENLFSHGTSERTCYVSPDVLSWFAEKAMNKVQLVQKDKDKTYGIAITKYLTPHGTLDLILHPLLTNGYAGKMVAVDMADIYYRPLAGRDTTLKTNIQAEDEDGQRDMYITEAGVQLRLPLKHGIFTLT